MARLRAKSAARTMVNSGTKMGDKFGNARLWHRGWHMWPAVPASSTLCSSTNVGSCAPLPDPVPLQCIQALVPIDWRKNKPDGESSMG